MRDQANDHLALRFIVNVHERDTAGTGLQHAGTCFVEGSQGVDRHGFDGCDAYSALNIAEAAEFELVDLREGIGALPVVLHDVDVVRYGEEAGKGRGFGIPEWR